MWRGEGVGKKEKSPRVKMEKRERTKVVQYMLVCIH